MRSTRFLRSRATVKKILKKKTRVALKGALLTPKMRPIRFSAWMIKIRSCKKKKAHPCWANNFHLKSTLTNWLQPRICSHRTSSQMRVCPVSSTRKTRWEMASLILRPFPSRRSSRTLGSSIRNRQENSCNLKKNKWPARPQILRWLGQAWSAKIEMKIRLAWTLAAPDFTRRKPTTIPRRVWFSAKKTSY